jgi:aspartate/methionine/tyrosine aminotransferase
MQLRPFLLDQWIARFATADVPFNLAGSTGPQWTLDELLRLDDGSERRLHESTISYQPAAGRPQLREAIAQMSGVPVDEIVATAGGSEALFHAFFFAAGPGANVIVPFPAFPPYHAIPTALGIDVRSYCVVPESGYRLDVDRIKALVDRNTRLILVNSPHNPTGAVFRAAEMGELHAFAAARHVQLICDEVFHPIYHGSPQPSASTLPHATVIGDLSKAFALPGLRIGWIREPDAERRAQYVNAREYLSISNTVAGELLAEIAVRNRDRVHGRTQAAVNANLPLLDEFMDEERGVLDWVRPSGGTTAFIRFRSVADTRPFCESAAEKGLLLTPGDCFDIPDHVRLGLGVEPRLFAGAIRQFAELITPGLTQAAAAVTRETTPDGRGPFCPPAS